MPRRSRPHLLQSSTISTTLHLRTRLSPLQWLGVAAIANLRPQLGRWLQKTKTRPGGDGEIHGSTTFQPDGHIETEHGNSTQVAIDSLHRGPLSKTAAHELISALSTALDRAAINKNVDRSAKCICGCRHKPKGLRR